MFELTINKESQPVDPARKRRTSPERSDLGDFQPDNRQIARNQQLLQRHADSYIDHKYGHLDPPGIDTASPSFPSIPVMQRALTVNAVDFNPVIDAANEGVAEADQTNPYENVALSTDTFIQNIRGYLLPNANAQPYPDGNAVIAVLAARQEIYGRLTAHNIDAANLNGQDIGSLAAAIRVNLQGETALGGGDQGRLLTAITAALVAITPTKLTEAEGGDFDTIIQNVGGGSRAKGAPTQITVANMPGNSGAAAQVVEAQIQARNALLVAVGDQFDNISIHDNLGAAASTGLDSIRTTHANGAGWLPAVAIPGNLSVPHLTGLVDEQISSKTRKRARANEADQQGKFFTAHQQKDYTRALKGVLGGLGSNRNKLIAVWGGYSHSIGSTSPYIEFSIAHPRLNRLVYDFVNGRMYVTFHYNWHKGYNPFFRVTDLGDGY